MEKCQLEIYGSSHTVPSKQWFKKDTQFWWELIQQKAFSSRKRVASNDNSCWRSIDDKQRLVDHARDHAIMYMCATSFEIKNTDLEEELGSAVT